MRILITVKKKFNSMTILNAFQNLLMWKIKGKFCLINLLGNLEKIQAFLLLFKTAKWSRMLLISSFKFIKSIDLKILKDLKITLHYSLNRPDCIQIERSELSRMQISTTAYTLAQNVIVKVLVVKWQNDTLVPLSVNNLREILELSTQVKIKSDV
ncbi:hypothetical protein FGO68_gene4495 [Halteria grandinella]|uniref:Uncharacterized protein n=1 Tax=Halteria grandinella TaxID=5974 RepID=A0A8J8NEI5_HALGN|nr:hypothetical protein FGO68_gene4495 [Halteria grandinella]